MTIEKLRRLLNINKGIDEAFDFGIKFGQKAERQRIIALCEGMKPSEEILIEAESSLLMEVCCEVCCGL